MAASLENSGVSGKPSTIKMRKSAGSGLAVPVITQEQAVQILSKTLEYCLQSGLMVQRINDAGRLILVVQGVQYDSETADLRLVAPEAAPSP